MTWFQLIAAIAFSIALTWLGYVIVIDAKERADESVRIYAATLELVEMTKSEVK